MSTPADESSHFGSNWRGYQLMDKKKEGFAVINIPIIRLVMKHDARASMKDKKLHWTDVECADSSSRWEDMDVLLKHRKISIIHFKTTKQNIDNSAMWRSVIENDYANVLKLLFKLCKSTRTMLQTIGFRRSKYSQSEAVMPGRIIREAAQYGSVEIVRMLINRAVGVTSRNTNQDDGKSVSDATSVSRIRSWLTRSALRKLLNARNWRDLNVLMIASDQGTMSVVKVILESFDDTADKAKYVNMRGGVSQRSALMLASMKGHKDIVEQLFASGADITARDKDGWTGLMLASGEGHISVVESLLAAFSDASDKVEHVNECGGRHRQSALMLAIGHHEIVELLVASGADVTARDALGSTGLMFASGGGHLSIVKTLLATFSETSDKAKYFNLCGGLEQQSALLYACVNGHKDIVELLVASGSDITARDIHGRSGLIIASSQGHVSVAELLLASGGDVIVQVVEGMTELMLASQDGHLRAVESLVATFSDASDRAKYVNTHGGREHRSALLYACVNGHNDISELLLAAGADLMARDKIGQTALMCASYAGHLSVVEQLVASGADLMARDKREHTSLICASWQGHVSVLELLVASGADVMARGGDGWTALMLASQEGHLSVVKSLLATFSDASERARYVNMCTIGSQQSALSWAMIDKRNDIRDLLLASGASKSRPGPLHC